VSPELLAGTPEHQVAPEDLEFVSRLVRERSANVLDRSKEYLIEARLLPIARSDGLPSVAALVERVRQDRHGRLAARVVEALTRHDTSFFRDVTPFEALRKVVLPELVKRRGAEQSLRFWSAACASGQEAYSLLMTLCDHFPQLRAWDVKALGTDLSDEKVQRAADGRFSQVETNRGLTMVVLLKHFQADGVGWQVNEQLRALAEFSPLNLADEWPDLPPMDVILLRNVLDAFDVATRRTILARVRKVLRSDGYLVLGARETLAGLDDSWTAEPYGNVVLWRP
jgi:chemotaxis protein methyltransferase CheR